MKRFTLDAAFVAALATASAAGSEGQTPAQLFDALDADHDGSLGADEVSEDQQRFFERLVRVGDGDADGRLTKDEFVAALQEDGPAAGPGERDRNRGRAARGGPGAIFERLDRNKDGKVTRDEVPEQLPQPMRDRLNSLFDRAEKEALSREDFRQLGPPEGGLGGPRPEGGDGPRPFGGPGGFGGFGRGGFGPREGGPAIFRVLDENHDGQISRDELANAADKFQELDRNEDGQLDPSELIGGPGGFAGFGGRRGFGGEPGGAFGRPGERGGEVRPDGERGDDRRGPPREGDERGRRRAGDGPPPPERPRPPEGAFRDAPPPRGPEGGPRLPEGPDFARNRDDGPRPDERRVEGSPPRPERRGPAGERRPSDGRGREPGGRPGIIDVLRGFDRDGDGAISREEAPERIQERFERIDRDGNGRITMEEFRETIIRQYGLEPRDDD